MKKFVEKTPLFRTSAPLVVAIVLFGAAANAQDAVPSVAAEQNAADPVASSAASVENPDEKEAFQKSVRRQRFPWYSSKDGSLVYLPPEVEKIETYRQPSERASTPPADFSWMRQVYWSLSFVLILALVGLLSWALYVAYRNRRPTKETDEKANRTRRLETLAPEARDRLDDLGDAAANAFAAEDYRAAIVFYFSWFLVEADKRRLLLMNKGKTNREYWFELDGNIETQTIYKQIMDVFERVYFGGRPINRGEFEAVWTLREPFEEILRQKDADEARRLEALKAPQTLRARADRAVDFGPTSRSILIGWTLVFGASLVALAGCDKRRWNERYVDASFFSQRQSMNDVSVFADYSQTKTKRVDRDYYSAWVDGTRYETIVWFYRSPYSNAFDLKSAATQENGEKIDDLRSAVFPNDRRAFENARLEIEKWLKKKPNRTFVFVPNGWRADVDFWTAYRNVAPPTEKKWIDERLKTATEDREKRADFNLGQWNNALETARDDRKERRAAVENAKKAPRMFALRAFLTLVVRTTSGAIGTDVRDFWTKIDEKARKFAANPDKPLVEIASDVAPNDDCDSIFTDPTVFGGCNDPNCPTCYPWKRRRSPVESEIFDGESAPYQDATRDAQKTSRPENAVAEPWFRLDFLPKAKRLERFSGADDWTKNLPPTKEYWATRTVEPIGETETLLSVDDESLIARRKVGESQFFVVSSPAFLLNYSLLDPTNRVLTARLTDEFNPKGRALVFVGLALDFLSDDETPKREEKISPFSLSQFTPFSVLVWHLIALTTLVVCWRFPIFGRPKRIATEKTNDFGKHVDAVAFLLEQSDARRWSRDEIESFRAAREAGLSFAEPSSDADPVVALADLSSDASANETSK